MRTRKEKFGTWLQESEFDKINTVTILGREDANQKMTPEEMVVFAIKLAKKYHCEIHSKVEYHPLDVGGRISFEVKCNSCTSKSFYYYGTWGGYTSDNPVVTEKDLNLYELRFGTRVGVDPYYKESYWFKDNWDGNIREFSSLEQAKKIAKHQVGNCVYIYKRMPFGETSKLLIIADASGHTPP